MAESRDGYISYKGIGKELAGLLYLVNTRALAVAWCAKEAEPEPAEPPGVIVVE